MDQVQATFSTLHSIVDGGFPSVSIHCLLQPPHTGLVPSSRATNPHDNIHKYNGRGVTCFYNQGPLPVPDQREHRAFPAAALYLQLPKITQKLFSYLVLRNEPPNLSQLKWDQLPWWHSVLSITAVRIAPFYNNLATWMVRKPRKK